MPQVVAYFLLCTVDEEKVILTGLANASIRCRGPATESVARVMMFSQVSLNVGGVGCGRPLVERVKGGRHRDFL